MNIESARWQEEVCMSLNTISEMYDVHQAHMAALLLEIVRVNANKSKWKQETVKDLLCIVYEEFIAHKEDGDGNG